MSTDQAYAAVVAQARGGARHHAPAPDDATRALLVAVHALREQLPLLEPGEDTALVDGELEALEADIARTGRADAGRLGRLRTRLAGGATAVGALASAATLVRGIERVGH